MKALLWAAMAVSVLLCTAAVATPLEDCAPSSVPLVCLDAKLKAANKQLNATLKSAQDRLEQLQAQGRRPVLGAFIDSQRKFNAYRDAQCNWQGVRAPSSASSAAYVKDCQIRITLERERELAEFVADRQTLESGAGATQADESQEDIAPQADTPIEGAAPVEAPPPVAATPSVEGAVPATSANAARGERGNEWHLVKWVVNGAERPLIEGSIVSVSFDPSGKLAGNASVNRFSGTYRFDVDGRLEWPRAGFALTKMAGSAPLMAQERKFLETLRRTTKYHVEEQQLVLQNQSGTTALTFAR